MPTLIVVENPRNWNLEIAGVELIAARDYLTDSRYSEARRARVVNMCRRYGYQTIGYWVSLLAEARGHRPMPSVATLQDLALGTTMSAVSDELDGLMQKCLGESAAGSRTLRIYFGTSPEPGVERLARALFNHLPSPLLQAEFRHHGRWELSGVRPIAASQIPDDERPFVAERALKYFQRRGASAASVGPARYDLAILFDPEELDAPSDEAAIRKFIRAAGELGMEATVIGREDGADLAEYDALFIRETTYVDRHTYRFARRAEAEGLVVIDAPEATLRCTNKVYLAELFARNGVSSPRTMIVHRQSDVAEVVTVLGFPVVLKRPDSSFSQGVRKAADEAELRTVMEEFFRDAELLVAQEFTPTEFDWRIGVLDGRFLYGCKYHMAAGHWQIQRSGAGSWRRYGKVEAVPRESVPDEALELAVRAAGLIGDGLFGVDIKEIDGRFLVIEVNDNPNIDAGYEDGVLGDELYREIMRWFLKRLERRGLEERTP